MRKPLILQGYPGKTTLANTIAEMYGSEPIRIAFTRDDSDIISFINRLQDYEYCDMTLVIVEEVPTVEDLVFFHEKMKNVSQPTIYITQDTAPVPEDFNGLDGFNSLLLRSTRNGVVFIPNTKHPLHVHKG